MSITKKGMFAGNPEVAEFLTHYKNEDSGGIKFGKAVAVGTDEDQATLVGTAGDDLLGIAIAADEKIGTDDARDYDQYDTMKIGQKGIYYVQVREAVNAGDPVGVISSSNGDSDTTGDFGTASTYTEIDAQFVDGGSIDDEVRIKLNLPM